ncbi:MAG: hypothetical protein JHC87_06615 [Thermoleophilaceae bacterium]|nr:hypothetical protein [Thermoleophilaceae bacterium]
MNSVDRALTRAHLGVLITLLACLAASLAFHAATARAIPLPQTPQTPVISGGPNAGESVDYDSFTFDLSVDEGPTQPLPVAWYCRVDSESFSACSGAGLDTYSASHELSLANGAHTFETYYTYGASLQSPHATRSFTIAVPGPAPTISYVTADPGSWAVVGFQIPAGHTASSVTCTLDGGTVYPTDFSIVYDEYDCVLIGLSSGAHTVHVAYIDAADSVKSAVTDQALVMNPGTEVTFRSPPTPAADAVLTGDTLDFAFDLPFISDGNERFCTIDAINSAPCEPSNGQPSTVVNHANLARIADGAHDLQVAYVNSATLEAGSGVRHFSISRLAAPVITAGPANASTNHDGIAHFTFTASAVTAPSFHCALDNGEQLSAFSNCSEAAGQNYDALESGSYTFWVYATDALGNATQGTKRKFKVVRPSAPKIITPSYGEEIALLADAATLSIEQSSVDAGAGGSDFECSIDGGSYSSCPLSIVTHGAEPSTLDGLVGPLTPGIHTLTVHYTPHTGALNGFQSDSSSTLFVVGPYPSPVLTGGPSEGSTTSAHEATYAFDSNQLVLFAQCAWDQPNKGAAIAAAEACDSSTSKTGLADGPHNVWVIFNYPNGDTAATRNFTVQSPGSAAVQPTPPANAPTKKCKIYQRFSSKTSSCVTIKCKKGKKLKRKTGKCVKVRKKK